jgi:optic atrophy 3 protein
MRLRLGLLQDPAAIDRQIAREAAEAEAKRKKAAITTVKTEAQMKADLAADAKEREDIRKKVQADHKPPRVRPLSESKAIDSGANFVAESFLFLVAGGLILYESRRNKKKSEAEHDRRDDEIEAIRAENSTIKAEVEQLRKNLFLLQEAEAKDTSEETSDQPPLKTRQLSPGTQAQLIQEPAKESGGKNSPT